MKIREQVNDQIHASGSRAKLVNLCDINNQKKSSNPNYGKAESLESLKTLLKSNDIKGYVQVEEMTELDNPYIFISTNGLLEYLKKHGPKCVMVDATHDICQYDQVKLTTVVVRSPGYEAVPVAFLISLQTTIKVYEKFVQHIIERTGPIATNIFMADMDDNFYKAWINSGNTVRQKRVCVWHVHKAWDTNKSKLNRKADEIVDTLKKLTYVVDEGSFRQRFTNLIQQMKQEESSKVFAAYMGKYYGYEGTHPPAQWASCYVQDGGPTTNMQLEKFHAHLKTKIMGNILNIRYDKLIRNLIKYIKWTRDTLIRKSDRQPFTHRRHEVHKRHTKALDYATELQIIEIEGQDEWQVPFGSDNSKYHTLSFRPENCPWRRSCLKCLDCCGVCAHVVTCSCDNFRVESDCKHKHALIIHLPFLSKRIPKVSSSEVEEEIRQLMDICPISPIESWNDEDVPANSACSIEVESVDNEGEAAMDESAISSRDRLKAKFAQLANEADSMEDDECNILLQKIQSLTEPTRTQVPRRRAAHNKRAAKQTYFPSKK